MVWIFGWMYERKRESSNWCRNETVYLTNRVHKGTVRTPIIFYPNGSFQRPASHVHCSLTLHHSNSPFPPLAAELGPLFALTDKICFLQLRVSLALLPYFLFRSFFLAPFFERARDFVGSFCLTGEGLICVPFVIK